MILDDFSNSKPDVVERIARIIGQQVPLVQGDVGDSTLVRGVIERHQIEAVFHLAAFKAASQSLARPLVYYRNNVASLIRLLEAMDDTGCRTMVFSRSATVYGEGSELPSPRTRSCAAPRPTATPSRSARPSSRRCR